MKNWFLMFGLCCRKGIWYLGFVHDISKYSWREKRLLRYEEDRYEYLWLHYRNNKHFWQHWVYVDSNGVITLDMPRRYRKEMLCRWLVNADADRKKVGEWYSKNKEKMILHKNVREWIEAELFYDN